MDSRTAISGLMPARPFTMGKVIRSNKDFGAAKPALTPRSSEENQLKWIFGLPGCTDTGFTYRNIKIDGDREISFAERFTLDELLYIEVKDHDCDEKLDAIVDSMPAEEVAHTPNRDLYRVEHFTVSFPMS